MAVATAQRSPAPTAPSRPTKPASQPSPTRTPVSRSPLADQGPTLRLGAIPSVKTVPNRPASGSVKQSESGARVYVTRDGTEVELPPDMTVEEAAEMEAKAIAKRKQRDKEPPPKPVADEEKPGDKGEKKEGAKKGGKKGAKGKKGKGKPGSKGAGGKRSSVGGKIAQYLIRKAAPAMAKGKGLLGKLSRNERTHDNAEQMVQQSEKAVEIPQSEGQSKSNNEQVKAVDSRPAPKIDETKGQKKLQDSLLENIPRDIEEVDNFKADGKGQRIGAEVAQVVKGDTEGVVSTFGEIETTPAPTPREQEPEPLPTKEPAPSTANMNLGQDLVAPLLPEHTDVSEFTNEADAKLAEEGITQEQLDMVDSGDLAAANKEKKGLEKAAKTEPAAVQKLARQEAAQVDTDLKREEKKERGALANKRKVGLGQTTKKQKEAKTALEKKRDEVAAKINGIYKAAQDKVKKKLADLEVESMARFDAGNAKATAAFENGVKRELDVYKADRYSGVFGWARKGKDWLLGMDELPAVKAIFERNRATFVTTIDKLVADISADNKKVVLECKAELVLAKKTIKEYVDGLEPGLKGIGKKTAGEVNRQLEELDGFIKKKEDELQDKLADKQQAAVKAIDEKIEKMKEAMSGALSKLGKLLLLAAKKFFTWALSKFGYSLSEIEGIISKGAAVLKAIFTKPIVFVKNLMRAAILGFQNFGKNFLKHLKDALFEWLTGSLTGIDLPTSWDFKGVVKVALQMIGISYQNIRKHMVTVMGEPVVAGLEKGFTLVKTLITEGPMAAWEQLKEMAGEMRDAFVDAVKDFIKTKIIQEAIKFVVALFVPGAGIIKAIIGIYDTVVFFIQKAKQIAKMVSNFLGSIGQIAAGNIGAAAGAMESGLARGLTLVISFLAQLLHMNGITAKIRDAIGKVKAKVDAVLLKVAKWIAGKANKLFGSIKAGAKALLAWWKKKKSFSGGGESHTLLFQGQKDSAQLMVKSTPKKPEDFVRDFVPENVPSKKAKQIGTLSKEIDALKKKVATAQAKTAPDEKQIADLDKELTAKFNALGQVLATVLNKSEDDGSEKNPLPIEYPKRRAAAYQNIYIGPPTEYYLEQNWLKIAAATGGGKKSKLKLAAYQPNLVKESEFKSWSGSVGVYRAAGGPAQSLPDGGKVGLDPAFASLAPGKVLIYDVKGSTGGGGKINRMFRPFGFRPGKEGLDGDHVMERQLGGPDIIPNLWPLKLGENRSSGSKVKSLKVIFKGKIATVHEARQKRKKPLYLLVKKTVESS